MNRGNLLIKKNFVFFLICLGVGINPLYAQLRSPLDSIPNKHKELLRKFGENISLPLFCKVSMNLMMEQMKTDLDTMKSFKNKIQSMHEVLLKNLDSAKCADYALKALYSDFLTDSDLIEINNIFNTESGRKVSLMSRYTLLGYTSMAKNLLSADDHLLFKLDAMDNESYRKFLEIESSSSRNSNFLKSLYSYFNDLTTWIVQNEANGKSK